MNRRIRTYILYGLFGALLIANAYTLFRFWRERSGRDMAQKDPVGAFLVRELGLDSSQQRQLRGLTDLHREQVQRIRPKIRHAKEELFALLRQADLPDSLRQAAARKVGLATAELELATLEHFRQVRAICRPDQQARFDGILNEVVRLMAPRRPSGAPGRDGGGPPPDGPEEGPRPPLKGPDARPDAPRP